MNKCKKFQKFLPDALYGKLSSEQDFFLTEHAKICDKCRIEYGEIKSTLKTMDKRVRPEPDSSFWDGYWDRLATRMEKEKVADKTSTKSGEAFRKSGLFLPRWTYQAAAAMLLIAVGIFIGRMLYNPKADNKQIAALSQNNLNEAGIELAQRTQNYIQRSKTILLALVNFDLEQEDIYTLDFPYQQQVSQELIQEAGWIKGKIVDSRQQRLQELITDLEAILLQIANLETESDLTAVELIQTGVKSRGILFKIHLADTNRSWEGLDKSKPASLFDENSKRF